MYDVRMVNFVRISMVLLVMSCLCAISVSVSVSVSAVSAVSIVQPARVT